MEDTHLEENTISLEESLIIHVRDRPALWNIKLDPAFRTSQIKDPLWAEVCELLPEKLTVARAKRKWKNLTTTYGRISKTLKTTSGQAAPKVVKWKYFDIMDAFMKSVDINSRPRVSNMGTVPTLNIDTSDDTTLDDDEENTTPLEKSPRFKEEE